MDAKSIKQSTEEQFVPRELSLKLREIGFTDFVKFGFWFTSAELPEETNLVRTPTLGFFQGEMINSPLWQQAFDWFKRQGLDSTIVFDNDIEDEGYDYWYGYEIRDWNTKKIKCSDDRKGEIWDTHLLANKHCLEALIELFTNKK